jgi:putative tryptophan/tyrosine transport system substrate-binding protein
MTTRRSLLAAVGALAASRGVAAPKPAKIPHVGYLSAGSYDEKEAFLSAFKDGLRELGYVDGKNIAIDVRWAGDVPAQFPELAASLVRERSSAIVTTCVPSTRAAKTATGAIPIVMSVDADPVAEGLVASLARPGAHVTGTATLFEELIGKWLELLSTSLPAVREFGILTNPNAQTERYFWVRFQAAARRLGVSVVPFGAHVPVEIERTFAQIGKQGIRGPVVMTDAFLAGQVVPIVKEAERQKVPAIYGFREFAEAGGPTSYGISFREYYKGVARCVDALLKGTKPPDLPVEQPTRIGLVVNLLTATLGLVLPQSILLRADQVLE